MTSIPDGRFVKLRLAADVHPNATIGLTAAPAGAPPDPATHPIVALIAKTDPARAQKVAQGLQALLGQEAAVLAWLEASAANSAQFLNDPATALRAAVPSLPSDVFDGWKG